MTKSKDTLAGAISGIYETHLPVRDLDRSIAFYRDQLGLTLATEIPERGIAFFWVGDKTDGLLGLWKAGDGPLHMVLHFAFKTEKHAVESACERLRAASVVPLGFHGEPVDEPVVIGWMPALSIYFKDPDGHSIELIHVLDEAPDHTFGIGQYSDWIARKA